MEATELTWRSRIDLEVTLRTLRENIRELIQSKFGRVSPEVAGRLTAPPPKTTSERFSDALSRPRRRAICSKQPSDALHVERQRFRSAGLHDNLHD